MRGLVRNMKGFYYALYEGKREILDEYGNNSGEYEVIYSKPIPYKGNISAEQGEIQSRQFGDSLVYDRVIVISGCDTPIDEHSILWVDTLPDASGNTPHDYIVKKVAKSLNVTSIAISKVDVRG